MEISLKVRTPAIGVCRVSLQKRVLACHRCASGRLSEAFKPITVLIVWRDEPCGARLAEIHSTRFGRILTTLLYKCFAYSVSVSGKVGAEEGTEKYNIIEIAVNRFNYVRVFSVCAESLNWHSKITSYEISRERTTVVLKALNQLVSFQDCRS